jgi:gamma-glutamyl-gamma-aminobutyrate hydrolase PuuD
MINLKNIKNALITFSLTSSFLMGQTEPSVFFGFTEWFHTGRVPFASSISDFLTSLNLITIENVDTPDNDQSQASFSDMATGFLEQDTPLPETIDGQPFLAWLIQNLQNDNQAETWFERFLAKGMEVPQSMESVPLGLWFIFECHRESWFAEFFKNNPAYFESLESDLKTFTLVPLFHAKARFQMGYIVSLAKHITQSSDHTLMPIVNECIFEFIDPIHFDGFIIPGASDTYPKANKKFIDWASMHEPLPDEILYQKAYEIAERYQIPTFGICAGAQHLTLYRKGTVTKAVEGMEQLTLNPFTWMHYMALSPESQKELLATCKAEAIVTDVARRHEYMPSINDLGEGVELAGTEDGVPLAFSRSFWNLATQYHPEFQYITYLRSMQNGWETSPAQRYSVQMIDSFLEGCRSYHHAIQKALSDGHSRETGVQNWASERQLIEDRLNECKAMQPDATPYSIWGLITNLV